MSEEGTYDVITVHILGTISVKANCQSNGWQEDGRAWAHLHFTSAQSYGASYFLPHGSGREARLRRRRAKYNGRDRRASWMRT